MHFFVEQSHDLVHIPPMSKKDCTDILKALADRSRMRIVKALLASGHGVNDLAGELKLSQYNVSKHLRVLKQAGIVDVEPDGTRREYFIVKDFRERSRRRAMCSISAAAASASINCRTERHRYSHPGRTGCYGTASAVSNALRMLPKVWSRAP